MKTKSSAETLESLQLTLKKKELEAATAKEKGQKSVYSNLLLEINLLKSKIKKFSMGSK
ncbi:MAG: hypothetical protein FWF73_07140 [Spirochaetes bacterium]|nr:hypothetical protein [Spirochaetota bacterium]